MSDVGHLSSTLSSAEQALLDTANYSLPTPRRFFATEANAVSSSPVRPEGEIVVVYSTDPDSAYFDSLWSLAETDADNRCHEFDSVNLCTHLFQVKVCTWGTLIMLFITCLFSEFKSVCLFCGIWSSK